MVVNFLQDRPLQLKHVSRLRTVHSKFGSASTRSNVEGACGTRRAQVEGAPRLSDKACEVLTAHPEL